MCTNFIVGISFVFDEWWIYNKSTWMYSSFTNLEWLSLVLGCFTYGSHRNDMANSVSGLSTLRGITWLLGWGWPAPGWLGHGLSAMLMWRHDFWRRHSLQPVRQSTGRGTLELPAPIPAAKPWDAAHWHLATHCRPTGRPVSTTGLWAACDFCIWWVHCIAELQLGSDSPQFQWKWRISQYRYSCNWWQQTQEG